MQTYNLEYIIRGADAHLRVDKKHKKTVLNVLKHFNTQELYLGVENKEFESAKSELAFEVKYKPEYNEHNLIQLYPNMNIAEIKYVNNGLSLEKTQESVRFKMLVNDWDSYWLEIFLKPQKSKKR